MSITAAENYWRVVDHYRTAYNGDIPRTHLIGHAATDADRILYSRPAPPSTPKPIINWGKPLDEQVWTRAQVPHHWTRAYLNGIAEERYVTKIRGKAHVNYNWFRNDDNLTEEQFLYKEQEWDRRLNGLDIMIGGTQVYLTGPHYTYLQHWWLDGKPPEFRERDLLWFYTWQHVVEDPLCYGKMEPKHRRAGDTSKSAFVGWEIASRTYGGHFGMQATGENQSSKIFRDKVVPGWKRLVPFFSPIYTNPDNPVDGIFMDVEARRGASKNMIVDGEEGLEAWIRHAPKGKKGSVPFDGDKLHCYLRDEGGKATDEDIEETWDIIKPCLLVDGVPAKAVWPSTVEEIEGDNQGRYHSMFRDSLPSLAETTGTMSTISGMKSVFIPCYCGHSDPFIGRFGQSIVHKPSLDDKRWLLANRHHTDEARRVWSQIYDQGGAYEYEVMQRGKAKNLVDYCRRFPFTIDEVFAPTNPNSDFNVENLGRCLMSLQEATASGGTLYTDLVEQGNFEWVDQVKGDVKWVPGKNGRILFNMPYMPGTELARELGIVANAVSRGPARQYRNEAYGLLQPSSGSWIKIGSDPQKSAEVDRKKGKRYSSAAAHGFYPYNPMLESTKWTPQAEIDRAFSRDYRTHAFIFEYIVLPKNPRQHHEDMLKACIFLNARMLYERQLNEMGQWFREMGCGAFLITDKAWIKNPDNAVPGVHSDPHVIELYKGRIREFTELHAWPRRCPFPRTLNQWIEFKLEDIERFDAVVASGFSLLAAQPGPLRNDQKKSDIASGTNTKPRGIESIIQLHM